MNNKLEQRLFEKFPVLYRNKDLPMTECLMCFGFCCGDGWYNIIHNLSNELEKLNDNLSEDEKIMAFQVKEKFGGLRFYINHGTEEVYELISMAEKKSLEICEECGAKGKIINLHAMGSEPEFGAWYAVRCDKCMEEFKNEHPS